MSKHGQHILACSCLYLANKFRKIHPSWTQKQAFETSLNEEDLRKCAKAACQTVRNAQDSNLCAAKKKYSKPEYMSISLQPELKTNS